MVLVIHEVYGLTDWLRAVADQLAADGFIAIAPDMLTRRGPGGGGTDTFASRDDVVKAVRDLTPAQVSAALDAAARYGRSLPAASGNLRTRSFENVCLPSRSIAQIQSVLVGDDRFSARTAAELHPAGGGPATTRPWS